MKSLLLIFVFLSVQAKATWLAPEDIKVSNQIQSVKSNIMSEVEFKSTIKKIESVYAPIVKNFGGRLSFSANWKNTNPFAGTTQLFGTWNIKINGGLARNSQLTADGLTLILCHELGHHLAGFSFANPRTPIGGAWASNEGQADYFATHVCAKRLWASELEINAQYREKAATISKLKCDSVWTDSNQKDLCYRILTAADSMVRTMANLKNEPNPPNYATPDVSKVSATDHRHPATQCRMDTALEGALCLAQFNDSIIPGKNFPYRVENIESERESAQYTCTIASGFSIGLRPACWFYSRL